MKKLSIIWLMSALVFTTQGTWAQSKDKSVQSQKNLKTNTAKQTQIRTDQGVPFNAGGVHGAAATATTKDQPKQKSKTTTIKKKPAPKSSSKTKVNNPGVDSKNGH